MLRENKHPNKKTVFLYIILIPIIISLFALTKFTRPSETLHQNSKICGSNPDPVSRSSILEWFQKPAAIRFIGIHDRTYISWINNDGKIQMRHYDHRLNSFSEIYTIDDLQKDYGIEARDDHNAPSLLILPDGQILIFYAVHDANNAFFMKKSSSPEDITSWNPRVTITDSDTMTPYNYPQTKKLENGNIILFYRRGNFYNSDQFFKISNDNGSTWDNPKKLIDFGDDGIYSFIYLKKDYLHLAWNKSLSDNPLRKNVYYMQSPDGGKTWQNIDGTKQTLPVNEEDAEIVFQSSDNPAYVWDIVADEKQKPYIVFAHQHDPFHEFIFTQWQNGKWISSHITNSSKLYSGGNFYSGGAVIDPDNNYQVFLSKKRENLEIERWSSLDNGKTWKVSEKITANSSADNFRPQLVENYSQDFRLIWASGEYEGLINGQWTGFTKVDIQSEKTKNSIPSGDCL
jgi:hypothetical protein